MVILELLGPLSVSVRRCPNKEKKDGTLGGKGGVKGDTAEFDRSDVIAKRRKAVLPSSIRDVKRLPSASVVIILSGSSHLNYTENQIYVFLEKELRGLSPNSYIHVSVSDLYTSRIGPYIRLQRNRQTWILEIYKSLTDI